MDTLQILAELRAGRDRIDNAIAALESLTGPNSSGQTAETTAALIVSVPLISDRENGEDQELVW